MTRSSTVFARPTLAAVFVTTFTALTTSPARAGDELTTLEKGLADEHAALSTSDCSSACRALASIRRAADKICALEPGARCAAARAKAEDATRRVREACPECATASITPEPNPKAPSALPAPTETPRTVSKVETGSSPPAETTRGGCASCNSAGSAPVDSASAALALLALARAMRGRKKPPADG